jgi:ABC-2 type transport system ATP-binding protein
MNVIEVSNLHKSYGKTEAVRGISFDVQEGEIFGIVGPNGAGKTTTVECVEGLRDGWTGDVRVLGLHPKRDARQLKQRIGIQLQESILPDRIKVREALELFAALYKRKGPWQPVVEQLGLAEKMEAYYDSLSGGQKQRLSIAMALVNDPELVFFDELTTGLDPQARRNIWDMVEQVRQMGKTVVLVTHFMEEAERLCDRVAIIDHGRMIACDSPRHLIRNLHGTYHVRFTAAEDGIRSLLEAIPDVVSVSLEAEQYALEVQDIRAVAGIITLLTDKGLPFFDFTIQQPNLEDVFLELTGRTIRN